jgi:hypothetical protein
MNRTAGTMRGFQVAAATTLGLALAGCGGGGDSGAPPPPATTATLVLTSANRDSVAHSTAAGILAMSPVQTLPLAALSVSSRNSALGLAAGHRPGWLNHVIAAVRQPERVKGLGVDASRVRPLAVVGPYDEPCYYSGSISTTFDDRDGNGDISPADVLTLTFNACMDTPDETVDGTVVTTISEISADVMRARMTMTNLSDSTARHGTKMTGSMQFYYELLSSTTDITRLAAEGSVVAEVDIFHLAFTDTVTLKNGFVEELTYDAAAMAPGSTQAGLATLSVSGAFDSTAAGGSVEVFTRSAVPILKAEGASYPYAGEVEVRGKTGTLVLTVRSADSVRLDLDADDNGTPESTESVAWDWLF